LRTDAIVIRYTHTYLIVNRRTVKRNYCFW